MIGLRPIYRFKAKRPHPIKLRFIKPIEQIFKVSFGFAGKADHKT